VRSYRLYGKATLASAFLCGLHGIRDNPGCVALHNERSTQRFVPLANSANVVRQLKRSDAISNGTDCEALTAWRRPSFQNTQNIFI
jgi:hypothetical protein